MEILSRNLTVENIIQIPRLAILAKFNKFSFRKNVRFLKMEMVSAAILISLENLSGVYIKYTISSTFSSNYAEDVFYLVAQIILIIIRIVTCTKQNLRKITAKGFPSSISTRLKI